MPASEPCTRQARRHGLISAGPSRPGLAFTADISRSHFLALSRQEQLLHRDDVGFEAGAQGFVERGTGRTWPMESAGMDSGADATCVASLNTCCNTADTCDHILADREHVHAAVQESKAIQEDTSSWPVPTWVMMPGLRVPGKEWLGPGIWGWPGMVTGGVL
jgi:hypothetical protein